MDVASLYYSSPHQFWAGSRFVYAVAVAITVVGVFRSARVPCGSLAASTDPQETGRESSRYQLVFGVPFESLGGGVFLELTSFTPCAECLLCGSHESMLDFLT